MRKIIRQAIVSKIALSEVKARQSWALFTHRSRLDIPATGLIYHSFKGYENAVIDALSFNSIGQNGIGKMMIANAPCNSFNVFDMNDGEVD